MSKVAHQAGAYPGFCTEVFLLPPPSPGWDVSPSQGIHLHVYTWVARGTVRVANGKCETLRDGETSIFLCEPETFDFLDCETETFKVF